MGAGGRNAKPDAEAAAGWGTAAPNTLGAEAPCDDWLAPNCAALAGCGWLAPKGDTVAAPCDWLAPKGDAALGKAKLFVPAGGAMAPVCAAGVVLPNGAGVEELAPNAKT